MYGTARSFLQAVTSSANITHLWLHMDLHSSYYSVFAFQDTITDTEYFIVPLNLTIYLDFHTNISMATRKDSELEAAVYSGSPCGLMAATSVSAQLLVRMMNLQA